MPKPASQEPVNPQPSPDPSRREPRKLRICTVCSELVPFSKTGGLGDVTSALSGVLHRGGHDLKVFTPFYSSVDTVGKTFTPVEGLQDLELEMEPERGGRRYPYTVFSTPLPGSGTGGDKDPGDELQVFLIHCPALYERGAIYTGDADEPLRFAFLCRAAIESCQRLGWGPEIFHLHDWHTSLVPLYLKTVYGWDRLFAKTRTVLTIHNIGYQGELEAEVLEPLGLADQAVDLVVGESFNFLRAGILGADLLTTVSRTHAQEICTPEYGFGLDGLLRARADRLVGIVNGIDDEVWNPAVDELLPHRYTADDLAGKIRNRQDLCAELELPNDPDPEVPLLGVISRLTAQKGLDLAQGPLVELLEQGAVRFVGLGTGEPELEAFFKGLAERFPDRARFLATYSESWAHRIEAAADLFLMPSRYEPCGLNQMYSQMYGTPPVVRKTGGLADTVEMWNPETGEGTGFVFEHADPQGVRWALGVALETWKQPEQWRRLQRNGMTRDFSWESRGEEYVALYERLL